MICEFCGAELQNKKAKMCPVCGKKQQRKRKHITKLSAPDRMDDAINDGYDGYYDDVLPPDADLLEEGVDRDLIRNIILLCVAAVLIIGLCVALLYVL